MSDETLVGGEADTTLIGEESTGSEETTGTEVPEKAGEQTEVVKDGKADETLVGTPKEYEAFTLPEGMEADEASLAAFVPIAKEQGLNQEQAQALVTYEANRVKEFLKTQESNWLDVNKGWQQEVKADKELGGPAFDQSMGHAKTFLSEYGTPELMEALVTTGMGNHPEFIRAFSRAGKAMREDNLSTGGPGEGKRTAADILYPNQS